MVVQTPPFIVQITLFSEREKARNTIWRLFIKHPVMLNRRRRVITSFITISSQLQKKLDVAAAAASLID